LSSFALSEVERAEDLRLPLLLPSPLPLPLFVFLLSSFAEGGGPAFAFVSAFPKK
jgi:hypothetical protein